MLKRSYTTIDNADYLKYYISVKVCSIEETTNNNKCFFIIKYDTPLQPYASLPSRAMKTKSA